MEKRPSIRILVLDDELFMLKLLSHMLKAQGFTQVSAYASGKEALERLDSAQPEVDLVFCDLNMPEMDGLEFVRRLVDHGYRGSLILVSGEDERVLQAAGRLCQAHGVPVLGQLQKPVTPERLAHLLDQWVPPAPERAKAKRKAYGPEDLRLAIDKGELINFYQPQVDVATRRVIGVETLVRWRHPLDGLVFPDAFIGLAETHGLIHDLTRTVLKNALTQARIWQEEGLRLRVAVNLSMDNLAVPGFADQVAAWTAAAGVRPEAIVLEVTESRLMGNMRTQLEILTRLRIKHFHLSIDDFGTGHSSLSQLRDIPFDELKIDQGFVHGARTNDTLRAIYGASLALGEQLGMQVVAEGVEDQDDWDCLRETGCATAQGYFIARPMPAEDLPGWVEDWNARAVQAPLGRGLDPALAVRVNSPENRKRQAETVQAVRLAQRTMAAVPEQDLQVFSICEPLTDAGGDVFRCLRRADGSLVLVLADVAGHSVSSSYAVASFLGMLSTFVQGWQSLTDLFQRLNQAIQEGPFPNIPIAVLAAHWEPRTGRLHVLNAGNPHGIWHRKGLARTEPIALKGTPLGLFDQPRMQEKVLVLEAGDRVLFGTDGLFDTPSREGGCFRDQVPGHWARTAHLPVDQALDALCSSARDHGAGRFRDDVLLVGLEQPAWTEDPHELLVALPSVAASVAVADQALARLLASHPRWRNLEAPDRFNLILAFHEAITNAIEHGNGGDDGKRVALACRLTETAAVVRVIDEGPGFDLDAPLPPKPIDSDRSRGLPILRATTKDLRMRAGELAFQFEMKGAP